MNEDANYQYYIKGNEFSEVFPLIDRKRKIRKLIYFSIITETLAVTINLKISKVKEFNEDSNNKTRR